MVYALSLDVSGQGHVCLEEGAPVLSICLSRSRSHPSLSSVPCMAGLCGWHSLAPPSGWFYQQEVLVISKGRVLVSLGSFSTRWPSPFTEGHGSYNYNSCQVLSTGFSPLAPQGWDGNGFLPLLAPGCWAISCGYP